MVSIIKETFVILILVVMISSNPLFGQGRSETKKVKNSAAPGMSNPKNPNNPTGVPIDGGTGLLLAAGAAYGLKKLRDYRKGTKSNEV
ncbi:PID-CTERM protein-sorting domain-containing protein [Pontibacter sp. MBLB2868]|uniref:PID-CTERM protein-sorting domain-containing protein n=1 Tax=Pontibacter sp. MBLB2868 TaxID=3451555 RepID=UPI003F74F9D4